MNLKFVIPILILLICFGCEKTFIKKAEVTPTAIFDEFWNGVDQRYTFFPLKRIDWNEVRDFFEPFVSDDIAEDSLFIIMASMLNTLKDGHNNLISDRHFYGYSGYFSNFPENFNDTLLRESYYATHGFNSYGPFHVSIIGDIGYLRYESFGNEFTDDEIDAAVAKIRHTKGLIIDIRHNEGGLVHNVPRLAGRFATNKTLVGHKKFKTGPDHNDISSPISIYVEPLGQRQYKKPIVLLTNRRSYSASSFFALHMQALSNVTIIGDKTGGGGGIPVEYELSNGWIYNVSNSLFLAPDGYNIEDGVLPDIYVNMTQSDQNQGLDSIIEQALKELQ